MAASEFNFPHRAPTQFWMISTFALFVGSAVIIVGIYGVFVLRARLQDEARNSLLLEAQHFAAVSAQIRTDDDLEQAARLLSHTTHLQVSVWRSDSLLWDIHEGHAQHHANLTISPEVQSAWQDGSGVALREDEHGSSTLFAAVSFPRSDVVVRLGQEDPPLFVVMDRMQATLIFGMVSALILALLGSWLASKRVTAPLRSLTRSAQRIAEGDLEQEIKIDSRASEFQDLSVSLSEMEQQFRDDIDKLEKLIVLQNEFLGNVSHEVRNPIFAIGGYLEALGGDGLSSTQRKRYSEKGTSNLNRLLNLFSDLIEIARLEYREDLIQREPFRLDELSREVVETVRPIAADKGLKISVKVDPVEAIGDRSRIRQVLANLVDNAIAYTEKGSVQVRVTKVGARAEVCVIDTGHGIAEEHHDHIFDRFYRVDKARSRRYGGSGLGLSIVRRILTAHGESIDVDSAPGEGSRFSFGLPIAPFT